MQKGESKELFGVGGWSGKVEVESSSAKKLQVYRGEHGRDEWHITNGGWLVSPGGFSGSGHPTIACTRLALRALIPGLLRFTACW